MSKFKKTFCIYCSNEIYCKSIPKHEKFHCLMKRYFPLIYNEMKEQNFIFVVPFDSKSKHLLNHLMDITKFSSQHRKSNLCIIEPSPSHQETSAKFREIFKQLFQKYADDKLIIKLFFVSNKEISSFQMDIIFQSIDSSFRECQKPIDSVLIRCETVILMSPPIELSNCSNIQWLKPHERFLYRLNFLLFG